jgi:hypothetical protein
MTCNREGCTREATRYLRVTVAPYGYPIARGMSVILGLELCLSCALETKAADLFCEEGKRQLREATRIATKSEVPLDFTRTKIEVRRLGDADWQMLDRMRVKK